MEKAYNIIFKPHRRASLVVKNISPCIVYAINKDSAKELQELYLRMR